ncbi:hypothetical protein GGS20DRAFT_559009 [Poronia punctata]|nr:hypothetical protein GGS20DRAFT_559009 [Poronia punctata]
MASVLPRYLLRCEDGKFSLFPTNGQSYDYEIVSYRWEAVEEYQCDIEGVDRPVTICPQKLNHIKNLMCSKRIRYMWVYSLCIDKSARSDGTEEKPDIAHFYKQARKCYILLQMSELFHPQRIIDGLRFVDHIIGSVGSNAIASHSLPLKLHAEVRRSLREWAHEKWEFGLEKSTVRSAAIDLSVINSYATSVKPVISLLDNEYFAKVWTFQEMILGKNIEIIGVNLERSCPLGTLEEWINLATEGVDKATKLVGWIEKPRILKTTSVNLVLQKIKDNISCLGRFQMIAGGIGCARTDIINGGQYWWVDNQTGISNIFSAVSIIPRECRNPHDLFRGLLGIFHGLFTPQEIKDLISSDSMEEISFAFFKQLSIKTGLAWTRLSLSSGERGEWDWIPVVERKNDPQTSCQHKVMAAGEKKGRLIPIDKGNKIRRARTDIFAGVVNLGPLVSRDRAQVSYRGLKGVPRKYMSIHVKEERPGFHFIFKGCNSGRKIRSGLMKRETIPTYDPLVDVPGDETGRRLVQCATILGTILDPSSNIVDFRRTLLRRLAPEWTTSDPGAKPSNWEDRCVSGTLYENPLCPQYLRTHNLSMNYRMAAITECGSRLAAGSTADISCELHINCGCTLVAPYSLIFEAIMAIQGTSLGAVVEKEDGDGRVALKDGLGLVQIGDLGRRFDLVAFGGNADFPKRYAISCRRTLPGKMVTTIAGCPTKRALVSSESTSDMSGLLRSYGYVDTGAGNLLISRDHALGVYKTSGIYIDSHKPKKKERDLRKVMIG